MNSNYGKTTSSLNNFDFDFGLNTNSSRSLNDQKNKSRPNSYSYTSSSTTSFSQPKSAGWQPNKASWTPQPAAPGLCPTRSELGAPTSMVGDISGKSWSSMGPSSGSSTGIGIAKKDPNLFGDLVSSALGQNKSSSNVPLKSATPASAPAGAKSSFSMGNMANSLPKGGNSVKSSANNLGSSEFGSFVSASSAGSGYSSNLGGPSLKNMGSTGVKGGAAAASSKDPFSNLAGFGSKLSGSASLRSSTKPNHAITNDFAFGDFQNAPNGFSSSQSTPVGSTSTASVPKMDSFFNQNQKPAQSSGTVDFDMLFPSSSASGRTATAASKATETQQFSGGDDWDMEFGGGAHDNETTTELEGLPPPPAGVSASNAKSKGLDNYKQGQFADAIKWLSWAAILLEKSGDASGTTEALTCRASCYKEVGELKKAVADCTKVLENDEKNVGVLVQRALLYESMEKYKLGAEDLRTVMKLDPLNRVARSTIHRLNKMAE